jgi:hypothetical protein
VASAMLLVAVSFPLGDIEISQIFRPKDGVFIAFDFTISNTGINPKIARAEYGLYFVESEPWIVSVNEDINLT